MNDIIISNIISTLVLFLLYITFLFTPKISRNDLVFGILIPLDKRDDFEIKKILKGYYLKINIFSIIMIISYIVLLNTIVFTPLLLVFTITIGLIGYFLIFVDSYKKTKEYKIKNNLMKDKKQLIYVDTTLSQTLRKNAVISIKWFVIPIIISILNFIIPLINYDKLPKKIPMHWNINGVADNFIDKSLASVLFTGLVPIFITILLMFTNHTISISKNKIDVNQPNTSAKRLFEFKRINSLMIYCLSMFFSILITFFNFNSLNIISVNIAKYTPLLIILLLIIIIVPIALSIKIGQGGKNLKVNTDEKIDNSISNLDDDEFWKLGSFYCNPNDPSFFVEKRFGFGWTLNFANKKAQIISIIFVLFMLFISIFPIILSIYK